MEMTKIFFFHSQTENFPFFLDSFLCSVVKEEDTTSIIVESLDCC